MFLSVFSFNKTSKIIFTWYKVPKNQKPWALHLSCLMLVSSRRIETQVRWKLICNRKKWDFFWRRGGEYMCNTKRKTFHGDAKLQGKEFKPGRHLQSISCSVWQAGENVIGGRDSKRRRSHKQEQLSWTWTPWFPPKVFDRNKDELNRRREWSLLLLLRCRRRPHSISTSQAISNLKTGPEKCQGTMILDMMMAIFRQGVGIR